MVTFGPPRRARGRLAALTGLALAGAVTACWPGGTIPSASPAPTSRSPSSAGAQPPGTPRAPGSQPGPGPGTGNPTGGLDEADLKGGRVGPAQLDPAGTGLSGSELEAFLASRYEAFWDVFDRARQEPWAAAADGGPSLDALAAGEQLDAAREAVAELAASGEAIREADLPAIAGTDADTEHRVRVVSVDGAVAELEICMVNDDVRVSASGDVVSDEVWTVEARATIARTVEGWKLIRSRAVERVDGVGGCWVSPDDRYPH